MSSIRSSLTAMAVGLGLLLGGCASTPAPALVEQAEGADVTRFPSFAFFEPFDLEREGYSSIMGEDARALLRREMESRGYRLDPEQPALRINLLPVGDPQTSTRPKISLGLGLGFGGGSTRGGIGLGVPLGGGDKRETSRLPQAFIVDVVDTAGRRVVWTARVEVSRVDRREGGDRAALDSALKRAIETLPAR